MNLIPTWLSTLQCNIVSIAMLKLKLDLLIVSTNQVFHMIRHFSYKPGPRLNAHFFDRYFLPKYEHYITHFVIHHKVWKFTDIGYALCILKCKGRSCCIAKGFEFNIYYPSCKFLTTRWLHDKNLINVKNNQWNTSSMCQSYYWDSQEKWPQRHFHLDTFANASMELKA